MRSEESKIHGIRKTFKRKEKLKLRSDFRALYDKGEKVRLNGVKIVFLSNGSEQNRAGFPVSRRAGCAVKRNRLKRLNREAYRMIKEKLRVGYDFLLASREEFSLKERSAAFLAAFKKAALLKSED